MSGLESVALRFLELYGPFALLLFTFLETSMLFPFLPSEVVVPAAAALLISDLTSFLVFVSAASVGGSVGAFLPFYVFRGDRFGGSEWIRDRIDVSDSTIERGRKWFRRWGRSAVLWGRFLPALRSVVSIPAGIAGMTPLRFGVYTAVGTVGFYAAVGSAVYYGRRQSFFAAVYAVATDRPGLAIAGLLVVLFIALLLKKRSRRLES